MIDEAVELGDYLGEELFEAEGPYYIKSCVARVRKLFDTHVPERLNTMLFRGAPFDTMCVVIDDGLERVLDKP